jgi:Fe-S-cluster containining protein
VLAELTHGDHQRGDSLHLLVMDLHKQLNTLSGTLATEDVDGAHTWQLQAESDLPLIRAFMRGLHRTAELKFSHPGLDTAATRDGERLLIQNDIGTNDVHVLVIEVCGLAVSLTYSDLHPGRFGFFRQMLEAQGFAWQVFDPRVSDGLNSGKPYLVGQARLGAADTATLQTALEQLASRIVFVIDWNRARKRLQHFVGKPAGARHCWRRPHATTGATWPGSSQGPSAWSTTPCRRWTARLSAWATGSTTCWASKPPASTCWSCCACPACCCASSNPCRWWPTKPGLLLGRMLRQRSFEFDLLAEHAAYIHALAEGLCQALESPGDAEQTQAQVLRAKNWERQADHLLMDARQRAERRERWRPVVDCLGKADDVADALEEATFMHSLTLTPPCPGLPPRRARCAVPARRHHAVRHPGSRQGH